MPRKTRTNEGGASPEEANLQREEMKSTLDVYGSDPYTVVFPENMPESDYLAYCSKLGKAAGAFAYRVGDVANFGDLKYGYKKNYAKIAEVSGLDEQFIRNCASVSGRTPAELRRQFSLEHMRLMLARKNDKESVEHLVKRLGNKTHKQLRDMAAAGSASSGGNGAPSIVTASDVYDATKTLQALLEKFDSATKLPMLVQLETDKEKGGIIRQCASFLKALADQITDAAPETPKE